MQIHLHRHRIREITCDGTITINNTPVCDTAENSQFRTPTGTYNIVLLYSKTFKRKVPTLKPLTTSTEKEKQQAVIAIGNGIFNRNDPRIIIGTHIVPGCLKCSREPFIQLYDRINTSQRRGNSVTITISEE